MISGGDSENCLFFWNQKWFHVWCFLFFVKLTRFHGGFKRFWWFFFFFSKVSWVKNSCFLAKIHHKRGFTWNCTKLSECFLFFCHQKWNWLWFHVWNLLKLWNHPVSVRKKNETDGRGEAACRQFHFFFLTEFWTVS